MDEGQIMAYLALLTAAEEIGGEILDGVNNLLHKHMSTEDKQVVLARWQDNKNRAARNAGIDPATGLPIQP